MSTKAIGTDLEEIEITTTEKLLTVVLALFLVVGGLWVYSKIDEISESSYRSPATYFTASEQTAVTRANTAQRRLSAAGPPSADAPGSRACTRDLPDGTRCRQESARARERLPSRGARLRRGAGRGASSAVGGRIGQPAAEAAERRASREALAATRQSGLVTFAARLVFVLSVLAVRILALDPPAPVGLALPRGCVRHRRDRQRSSHSSWPATTSRTTST